MKEGVVLRIAWSPLLRIAAALALAVGSFVGLRQRYHGDCVIPDYDPFLFLLLPVLFLAGFVWLTSELACLLALATGMRPLPARLLSIAAALAAYTVVAYVAWLSAPVPSDQRDNDAFRALMSAFWSVGFLFKSGNFSDVSCGY